MKSVALVKTKNLNVVPDGSYKRGLLQNFFTLNRADFPKYLLLTTFNMNPEFMEEYVYSQIPVNCTTLIFYSPFRNDGGLACSSQGRKNIRFIRAKSTVFHPKFMLAISGQNILMGVSSANLTNGGWGGLNQEAVHLFADVERKDAGYSSIPRFSCEMAEFCIKYLEIVGERELYPRMSRDRELLQHIKSILSHKQTTLMNYGKIHIMHNYKESLFRQIRNAKICPSLKKIHIFSPVHFNSIPSQFDEGDDKDQQSIDNDLFDNFRGFFKDRSKASIDFYSSDEVAKDIIKRKKFVTFYRNKHSNSHLKAYVFENQKKVILASGSANFSKSAWKRTPSRGGNSEIMIMEDITKEWKGIQRELAGKSEKQEGVTVVEKRKYTEEGSFVTIIHQMDVSRISMDEHRVMIYALPELKRIKKIILEYYESGDDKKRKTQPLNIRKNRNEFKARGRLLRLVKARPLFVSYRQEHRDITVIVNYDYDDLDDEVYSPIENEYMDLFSYFGFRWKRGGSNPMIIGNKGRRQADDSDDSEIRNNYQSVHDKFYHDWKKIFRTLDCYRNHKKYRLLYENGLDMIGNFITRQKNLLKDDPERILHDCHVQFLSEYLYEHYR